MRRYPVYPASPKATNPVFALLCLAAWCIVAGGTAWGGTIRGTVRFTGAAVDQKKLPVTVDHSVCGKEGKEKDVEDIVLSPEKGIRNVAVSLQLPLPARSGRWPCLLCRWIRSSACSCRASWSCQPAERWNP
jgi:hypothetical protein